MWYSATLKADTRAGEEWVDLVLVHPEEDGDQGNLHEKNGVRKQDPQHQLRKLLPIDLKIETESEEADIDTEEATTEACDPAKVGLVKLMDEFNLEEPEIKETKALVDNETESEYSWIICLWY